MKRSELRKLAARFRVEDGSAFRLREWDTRDSKGVESKELGRQLLRDGVARLSELQEKLYAQDRWAVLLVFQAMDAAGKDGAIKHVMSGVNPQGCQVHSFKAPSPEELDHDFLWRTSRALPERGRIGIFNRSYYEEVLVVRVHPELLSAQKIPRKLVGDEIWRERYQDIRSLERYLARNGVLILKFFLHLSAEEQRERFVERLERSDKNWKFSMADVRERRHWGEYMKAYERAIRHTAAPHAPWIVVPADRKWFARLVVAETIVSALEGLDLAFPKVDDAKRKELDAARKELGLEGG
jgi:PPK2 family polyphosphate:nucleotide phosphotransferase